MDGYEVIHSELGALEWYRLFDPAIQLATEGFVVGRHLANALERHSAAIEASADLKWVHCLRASAYFGFKSHSRRTRFWNTATNTVLKEGDLLVQGTMANTLSDLAINGAQFLYEGTLAEDIVESIKDGGGAISKADMQAYEAEWLDAISLNLTNGLVFHSAPAPGSGTLLAAAVSQVSLEYTHSEEEGDVSLSLITSKELHKLVETLKFAYARRGELGDDAESRDKEKTLLQEIIHKIENSIKSDGPLSKPEDYGLKHPFAEDYGGAHLCILAPNGDAFAITSSLNDE
ncbi:scoloptoxin SSD14-like [Amblyomma americanum]